MGNGKQAARGDELAEKASQHRADFAVIDSNHPAQGGENIVVYAAGLGAVNPAVPTGPAAPSNPLSRTIAAPQVTVGGMAAGVLFSGLTPGYAGLYQLNIRTPEGLAAGDQELIVRVGDVASRAVKLPVQ